MKHLYASIVTLAMGITAIAQPAVQEVIFVNGGTYGTLGSTQVMSYDIETKDTMLIDTPMTGSVQALLVDGSIAFVAVDDSLIAYDLETKTRKSAVNHKLDFASADGLIRSMAMVGGKLIVAKQSPATEDFIDILNPTDLSFVSSIQGVSAEAADMVTIGDTLYVATPGGWAATEGSITVISIADFSIVRTIGLGADGKGMTNICTDGTNIYGFVSASSDWTTGATFPGKIVIANPVANDVKTVEVTSLGSGYSSASNFIGMTDAVIYFRNNGGIATFNMADQSVTDIVTGLTDLQTAIYDQESNSIFAILGNYTSPVGSGKVFDATTGAEKYSFAGVGVSPEKIGLYFEAPLVVETEIIATPEPTPTITDAVLALSVYPNPSTDYVSVSVAGTVLSIEIISATGESVLKTGAQESIDVSTLSLGIYTLKVATETTLYTTQIIKD